MTLNFDTLIQQYGYALSHEYWMAGAILSVMIYLTWREYGLNFFLVAVIGIGYGLFGDVIPGALGHAPIPLRRLLRELVINYEGIYGNLTRLVARWISLFLLFSGLMRGYGAFEYILQLALKSNRFISSGVAQSAVLASAIIGMVNGSQTANAGITGSITIPTMTDYDIRGESAAAIEAVASTSGQVLPPIMGTGAFIMASLLGVAYVNIIIAILIPTVILVVSIAIAVHFTSLGQDVDPNAKVEDILEQKKTRTEMLLDTFKFGVPFAALIYTLGIAQFTVVYAGLITVVTMLITGFGVPLVKNTLVNRKNVITGLRTAFSQTIDGVRFGAVTAAPIIIVLAIINAVVDVLLITGIPSKLSLMLLDLAGGVAAIAFVLSMVIGLILGLGMPTAAAYLIVALVIAPTLISQFGVNPLAAHFFAFYTAILAGVTPPVAPTVAVAAGIANADFFRACFEAFKISASLFVLPFTFVYNPVILTDPFSLEALSVGILVLGGALVITYALNHYTTTGRLTESTTRLKQIPYLLLPLVYFLLGAIAMIYPNRMFQLAVLAAAGGLVFLTRINSGSVMPNAESQ
jgi:TRAP transporter 4TM/12TM fusion protein